MPDTSRQIPDRLPVLTLLIFASLTLLKAESGLTSQYFNGVPQNPRNTETQKHGTAGPTPLSPARLAREHDFHITKCLVEYNEQEQALQISLNIFLDDLEEALRRQGADKLFLCTEKETPDAESYLERYLRQRLRLDVNGKTVEYTFLGKEISEDMAAAWCYLEITGVPELDQLTVTNRLLLEVYDDQKNIVSVFGPGGKKGLLLFQKGKDTESVTF